MFFSLDSGKTNRIHPLCALGTLQPHYGTALLQRASQLLSVLVLLYPVGSTQSLAAGIIPITSIEYGAVANYHLVEWDHPQLPINILRGASPAAVEDVDEAIAAASSLDTSQTLTNDRDDLDQQDTPAALPAVLYEIDLGEQGMLSVISAQLSVEPGHCAAIERGQDYLNLRRVHLEFCNPTNRPLPPSLTRHHQEIATLCHTIKRQPASADETDQTALHIALSLIHI